MLIKTETSLKRIATAHCNFFFADFSVVYFYFLVVIKNSLAKKCLKTAILIVRFSRVAKTPITEN